MSKAQTTDISTAQYTAQVADWAAGLSFDDLPAGVVRDAKRLLLDGVGCALFGSTLQWPKVLTKFVEEVEGAGPVTIWGTTARASIIDAAMVNGTAVHSFELDDAHPRGGKQHVGSVVIPAIIGYAEQFGGVSGRDALAAMVAGVEVGSRAGIMMGHDFTVLGWHSPALGGVFPAAVAAAKCAGVDPKWMEHALGLAATQAAGLHAGHRTGAMSKRWHAGKAAQSGLYAGLLSARGFTGPTGVFEQEVGGYCSTFSQGRSEVDVSRITRGLGDEWETSAFQFKIYSCRANIHTALDAVRMIRQENPLKPESIKEIRIWCGKLVKSTDFEYEQGVVTAAQMNMGYSLSAMILQGDCFIDQFSEASLNDPAIVEMSRKIKVIHDPKIDELGSELHYHIRFEVELIDGSKFERILDHPSGSPHNPVSQADLEGKFRKLGSRAVGEDQLDRILEIVSDFENLDDISVLGRALALP